MMRVVVVGGLAAGPAAAARAARLGAEVTLVEAGPSLAYGVCELPHVVAGDLPDAASIDPWSAERFEREKGVRVQLRTRAVALDAAARRIALRDERGRDRELGYDALVLATGSRPRLPRTGPARALKTPADAGAIAAAARRGARGVVLGAGYIGLLAAGALARRGVHVVLVDREPLPLRAFEPEARRIVAEELARHGVELAGGRDADREASLGADLQVAALGVEPETGLARAAGIELGASGGIRTDERGETSAAGVFAAGDCAEVVERVTGARRPIALATVANRTGWIAGSSAAGAPERGGGFVGALAFRAFGLEIGRCGIGLAEARAHGVDAEAVSVVSRSRSPRLPGAQPVLVSLIVDRAGGRLLGANVVAQEGGALRLNLVATQVAAGATVAELARLDLAYAPDFSPLVDPIVAVARQARRR